MSRAAIGIIMAGFLFCWAAPFYSQAAMLYPDSQSELSINKATLPQDVSIPPKIVSQEPTKTEISPASIKQIQDRIVNKRVFNTLYNKPRVDEKKALRAKWKKAFRADVWSPYYKAKEIEDKVCEKFRVKVLGIKGRPQLENNQAQYVFKLAF